MYDIIIIGGGPAGYVAAIRAAQLGATVCLIEKEKLGGTCLNHGCIPTKTLLHNADFLRELAQIHKRGVLIADPKVTVDMAAMVKHKNRVVQKLVAGVGSLLKSYGVTVLNGVAIIEPDLTVTVRDTEHGKIVGQPRGKKIIYAGGSVPVIPPIPGIELPQVLTSRTLLEMDSLPSSLVIIGGGVIGVEMAQIFSAMGTTVTILEMTDHLAPVFDAELTKELAAILKKQGVACKLGVQVTRLEAVVTSGGESVAVHYELYGNSGNSGENSENGENKSGVITADYVLISVGRRANLDGVAKLNLDTKHGFLTVNDQMLTSHGDIFAPGDVNGRCMLAHAAFQMAEVAAENALGHSATVRLDAVPQILYGQPEMASIGKTEAELRAAGVSDVRVGKFPFAANGKSAAGDHLTGYVKVLCDGVSGKIFGSQMLGPNVSELVNEVAALMSAGVSVTEFLQSVCGHPTCSEVLYEAAADSLGRAVHLPWQPGTETAVFLRRAAATVAVTGFS